MAVDMTEWLDLVDREYLAEFVTDGGSAVKFVVSDEAPAARVARHVSEMAEARGMLAARLDAAHIKLHMVQDVFFALSRQVAWGDSAQRYVEALFRRRGYDWPAPGRPSALDAVASANGIDPTILHRDVRRWLTAGIMHDPRMAQDFRVAMIHLCMRCFEPADAETSPEAATVLEWLRGEARLVGPLRRLQIFNRIGRHSARPMLRSLCRWLRLCGYSGLTVLLDLRRIAYAGRAAPGEGLRYTPAAVMDAYEVLRQLIDDAERMEGLLLVAVAGPEFLDGDPKRSVDAYTALKMRIWSDVRPSGRDNPLAPLVVLAGGERPTADGALP